MQCQQFDDGVKIRYANYLNKRKLHVIGIRECNTPKISATKCTLLV